MEQDTGWSTRTRLFCSRRLYWSTSDAIVYCCSLSLSLLSLLQIIEVQLAEICRGVFAKLTYWLCECDLTMVISCLLQSAGLQKGRSWQVGVCKWGFPQGSKAPTEDNKEKEAAISCATITSAAGSRFLPGGWRVWIWGRDWQAEARQEHLNHRSSKVKAGAANY